MDYLDPFGRDNKTEELLQSLEAQLPLLPEADQEFVIGCRLNLDSGFPLDDQSKQRLQQLGAHVAKVGHNTLERPFSPLETLRKLAAIRHQLTLSEQQFANQLAQSLQRGAPITPNEIQRLANLAASKGL